MKRDNSNCLLTDLFVENSPHRNISLECHMNLDSHERNYKRDNTEGCDMNDSKCKNKSRERSAMNEQ